MVWVAGWLTVANAGATPIPPPRDCAGRAAAAAIGGRPPMTNPVSLVSAVHPIRVWYEASHAYSATLAAAALPVLEGAWDIQVDAIGFRPPRLPDAFGGPEFDVYLVDYGPLAAFVSADAYVDSIVGDGHNGTPSFMVVDRDLPLDAVPSYFSHEFNHALQYATDFSETTLPIWEGTATAAQKWTVGELSHWSFDVPSYQEVPWEPALTGDSYAIFPATGRGYTYEYGAALFVQFLDEKLTAGNGAGGVALWESAANEGFGLEPDAVDAFATVAGMGLGSALNAFAVARFLTGDDWDPRGLADARTWTPPYAVPAEPHTSAELPVIGLVPVAPPMITGQAFFDVDLSQGVPAATLMTDPWLVVSATSASGLETGLAMLVWSDDTPYDTQAVGVAPEVSVRIGGLTRIAIGLTNLGPAGWDGDDDPYVPGDQRLTIDVVDRAFGGTTGSTTGTTLTDGTPGTVGDDDDAPADEGTDEGGCGCADASSRSGVALAVALVGALIRRRRAIGSRRTALAGPPPAGSVRHRSR